MSTGGRGVPMLKAHSWQEAIRSRLVAAITWSGCGGLSWEYKRISEGREPRVRRGEGGEEAGGGKGPAAVTQPGAAIGLGCGCDEVLLIDELQPA